MQLVPLLALLAFLGGVLLTAYFFLTLTSELLLRFKMKRQEKALQEQGIKPAGSSLSHGMCQHKKTGKLVSDQMESVAWYKRLME